MNMAPLTDEEKQGIRDYLAGVKAQVTDYVDRPPYRQRFGPPESLDHHYLYLRAPSKAIRPALLLSACEAVGGDPVPALPAACAVEVFHTWSLVHDDILDRDDLRRGRPTVHAYARDTLRSVDFPSEAEREHMAVSMAILVGDNLLAFSVALLNEPALREAFAPAVQSWLVSELATTTTNGLIDGEMRDCLYERRPIDSLTADEVFEMQARKTGLLLEFSMTAGAMLGLNRADLNAPEVRALREYARRCGRAFQIQDDILGLVGDPRRLSKSVGADVRAGKRTPIVLFAYETADAAGREYLSATLGNPTLSDDDVKAFVARVDEWGALTRARRMADADIAAALSSLEILPDSAARDRLRLIARFIVQRDN